MIKIKLDPKNHQIRPFRMVIGQDTLVMPENDSTHYNGRIDRQIKIPINEKYLAKLKRKKELALSLKKMQDLIFGIKVQQIDTYEMNKGQDALKMPVNESMHYDGRIDRQISIPLDQSVDEYLAKLKGEEHTLSLRKKR